LLALIFLFYRGTDCQRLDEESFTPSENEPSDPWLYSNVSHVGPASFPSCIELRTTSSRACHPAGYLASYSR
jgi:hypothetical protein